MNRRPKPGEGEEDLLAYQDEFLSSGTSPSAKLIRPGGKRTPEDGTLAAGRDVVQLDAGTVRPTSAGAASNKPPVKKSKFKQQRTTKRVKPQEGYPGSESAEDMMHRQGGRISKILSEVRERDTVTPIQMVPSSYAQLGFPTIKEVDLQQRDAIEEGSSGLQSGSKGKEKKKKSLFAQQFGEMPLSAFGIIDEREGEQPGAGVEDKDTQMEHSPSSYAEQFLDAPSIVSGEGLKGMGVSDDQVCTDLHRMHEENVRTLSAMPKEELQQEKEAIVQNLSPGLVAFLKKRREGEVKGAVERETAMDEGEPQDGGKPKGTPASTLPPEVKDIEGSWLHMDVTEAEKLEWMADTQVGQQDEGKREARFSFDGLLLPKSIDLPTTLGLHHHGDDPASAGYTLQELLHLSRSSVLQQRVLSIATLAKIIERDHRNEFAGILDHSPTHSLIDAGFPLLLRYALDEGSLGMMSTAVQATHSLLVVGNEEVILDSLSLCCGGVVLPSLETAQDHREEEEESKDDDAVLRGDVIKGLLQVKLLPRLRYVLEVMTPPPPVVDMILRILTRISRHSLQSASEVYNCPRLMDTIQTLCLDATEPHPAAVKLMIAVARAGRNLASQLVHKYKIMNTVIKSVAILPMSHRAQELYVQSCFLWRVLLSYGMGADHLRDTYSTLLGHLVSSIARLSDLTAEEVHCMCAVLGVLEGGLHVAAVKAEDIVIQDSKDVLQVPALDWSYARGVLQPVVTFVNTVTKQLSSSSVPRQEIQTLLLSHLLNILSSYAKHLPDMLLHTQSMVHVLQQIDDWFGPTGCVTAVVESGVLLKALGALSQPPLLSAAAQAGPLSLPHYEPPPTPPKLGVYGQPVMEQSDWRELLQMRAERLFASDVALSAFKLLDTVINTHKGLLNRVSPLLMDATVLSYLKTFHCQQRKGHQSVFSTVEANVAVHLVHMFTSLLISHPAVIPGEVITVYHQTCLGLLPLLPAGSEALLLQLLERSVLLPAMFWELGSGGGDTSVSERDLDLLTLHESPQMVTGEKDKTTRELLSEAHGCLPQIQAEVVAAVKRSCLTSKALQRSRDHQNHKILRVDSLLLPGNCGSLLPSDWPMLPLIHHYNTTVEGSGRMHSDATATSPKMAASVVHSLLLWLLLEHLRPTSMEECTVPAKFARLACVFLTSSDLFLDSTIHSCLAALLRMLTAPNNLSKLDFAAQVPGVSSFYDLYTDLVSQFSAVSYGDALFASFVLLPLQQSSPVELRRLVWGEQSHVLRALSLPIEQLPVPINNFLYPMERDENVMSLYRRALLSGAVKATSSPVMYRIAAHHLQNTHNT